MLFSNALIGQNDSLRVLKGKFLVDKEPFIGVSIYVHNGYSTEIYSNIDGSFELKIPRNGKFKLNFGVCLCLKHPKSIKIKETDKEILLELKKCNLKKRVIRKVGD